MIIPSKYRCDKAECLAEATYGQATSKKWFVVAYSDDPKYIAINSFVGISKIPERIEQWHACCWEHALVLQDAASVRM